MVFCFLFVRPWEKDALSKDLWTDLTILMWYEHTPKSNDRWKVILTEYKQILLWYSALPQSHMYLYCIFIQKAYLMFSRNIFQNSAKLGPDDSTDSGNSISPAFKYFKMKWLFTRDFEIVTLTIPTLFLGPHTYHCQKFVFTNFCTLSLNVVEINWWARDLFLQLLFPPKKR